MASQAHSPLSSRRSLNSFNLVRLASMKCSLTVLFSKLYASVNSRTVRPYFLVLRPGISFSQTVSVKGSPRWSSSSLPKRTSSSSVVRTRGHTIGTFWPITTQYLRHGRQSRETLPGHAHNSCARTAADNNHVLCPSGSRCAPVFVLGRTGGGRLQPHISPNLLPFTNPKLVHLEIFPCHVIC